ncbi:type IX secretion system membrane protein PorP/SprF [Galbibacter sp. EGI 63066]|uniref:PorP/SprF family type IX secretion system membrane protein n=1 Tax=Galbibacter sp. EGI 63066 TaxID=2993559 RepID=UPI002248C86A|nr:type IX secretion system membrane protein PorP/SprF [Galbibacter sp. EGI 63066]MCX2681982.1 type IX secretion system membrane protein PorP/SprF [Galbibacter sp. EGI 63066]
MIRDNYKRIVLLLLLMLIYKHNSLYGQQDPHYTQYTYNMGIINPAYIATKEALNVSLLARSQWVGVEGAPQTATFSLSSPVGRNVGLGLSVIHDEIGPVLENNIYADFSYTLKLSESSRLALGLKGGITFLDVELLNPNEESDPLNEPVHTLSPNFGAGAFYFTNKFYLGFAIPNMLETRHLEKSGEAVSTAAEISHLFLTSGFVFDLSDHLQFKPSTMVKAAIGAPVSVDLSANLWINQKFEVGVSFRFEDSLSSVVGFNVTPDFRIGYAYDHTLSGIGNYNAGSHEVMLSYTFNRSRIKSPRFF